MVGAATDDTITHAPLLKLALAYQWLYHNGPHFGYYLNMKKTIMLLPYIIAAMHREVDMAHASMLSPPPSYTAMQEVLDHLGYSADDYERFLLQVHNMQRQSHRRSYWLRLPEDKTVAQIAADIGYPATDCLHYLRTFQEWGGSDATCACRELCSCGKFGITGLWSLSSSGGWIMPPPSMGPCTS